MDHVAEQLKSRISGLSSEYYNHAMNMVWDPSYRENHDTGEMEEWVADTLRRIYLLIVAFLEIKNLPHFQKIFIDRYELHLKDKDFLLENGLIPFAEDSEGTLLRLREFEDFLLPFPEFDVFREEKKASNNLIESVLKNSNLIVARTNTIVTNEASVYNSVKWFIDLLFPSSYKFATAIFPGKFTHYKGDIAVPDLQTAIEYKLIRDGDNAEKYIDQVRSDAGNYKGNEMFIHFIAVLYFLNNTSYTEI